MHSKRAAYLGNGAAEGQQHLSRQLTASHRRVYLLRLGPKCTVFPPAPGRLSRGVPFPRPRFCLILPTVLPCAAFGRATPFSTYPLSLSLQTCFSSWQKSYVFQPSQRVKLWLTDPPMCSTSSTQREARSVCFKLTLTNMLPCPQAVQQRQPLLPCRLRADLSRPG